MNRKKLYSTLLLLTLLITAGNFGFSTVRYDIERKLEKAKGRFKTGRYDSSGKLLRKILVQIGESDPSADRVLGETHLLLGAVYEKFRDKKKAKRHYLKAKEFAVKKIEGLYLSSLRIYSKIIMNQTKPKKRKNIFKSILEALLPMIMLSPGGNFEVGFGKHTGSDLKAFETLAHQNYQQLSQWWEANADSNISYEYDAAKAIYYPQIKYGSHFENNGRRYYKFSGYSKSCSFRIYDPEQDVLAAKSKIKVFCYSYGFEKPLFWRFKNLLIGAEFQIHSVTFDTTSTYPVLSERKIYSLTEKYKYIQFAVAPILAYRPIFSDHLFLNISVMYSAVFMSYKNNNVPYFGSWGENQQFQTITAITGGNIENDEVREIYNKLNMRKGKAFKIASGFRLEIGLEIKF